MLLLSTKTNKKQTEQSKFNEMNFTQVKLQMLSFFFLLSFVTFAQEHTTNGRIIFGTKLENINPKNGLIKCVSSEYEKHLLKTNPNRATTAEFEEWLAPKVEEIKKRLVSGTIENQVITIPIVVHIIHNGDAINTNENISDAQILSQITVLNQDFRRALNTPGFNSNAIGADIGIEFCLAQRTPNGTATNGINRVNLGVPFWTTGTSVEGTLKAQTIWDPTQYFNIWVAKFTDNYNDDEDNLGGVLGYAQFPSNSGLGGLNSDGGIVSTDGVIIDYRGFGSSTYAAGSYHQGYDKGRTTTHEIGHCFGLRHIWGDNDFCNTNGTDSFKDFCPDTPAANDANYDCLEIYNSCPVAAGNDMTENYMDYSNDACMNTFTLNQKARILAVFQNSPRRASLKTSTACQTPLAVKTFDDNNLLTIYPNPATEVVNIGLGASDVLPTSYSIINTLGQVIAVKNVSSESDLQININSINAGVYFIKIDRENTSKTFKFIKK
jgi:hypothetical protein